MGGNRVGTEVGFCLHVLSFVGTRGGLGQVGAKSKAPRNRNRRCSLASGRGTQWISGESIFHGERQLIQRCILLDQVVQFFALIELCQCREKCGRCGRRVAYSTECVGR